MAKVSTEWKSFRTSLDATDGREQLNLWLRELRESLSDKSVYVIRTVRPFSIAYEKKSSPVLYIGEGNVGDRVRSHMKKWIADLGKHIPQLGIEVRYCRPIAKGIKNVHRDAEADLLWRFWELYGTSPLFNRQYEYHDRNHTYDANFFKVLTPGSGRGYHWALRPLASNFSYPSSLKGTF